MASTKSKADMARLRSDIAYNASALSGWQHAHDAGGPAGDAPVVLAPMQPWPARSMGREDQLLLAVCNISFQEVKETQAPHPRWERGKGELLDGWKGASYRATFSLNDGDPGALKAIMTSSRLISDPARRIPFVLGERDGGDGDLVAPPDPGRAPSLVLTMPRGDGGGVTLRFAYHEDSDGYAGAPSAVIEVVLEAHRAMGADGRRARRMTWDYCVTLNSASGRTPNESVDRQRYDAARAIMRPALAAMGVVPSRLAQ